MLSRIAWSAALGAVLGLSNCRREPIARTGPAPPRKGDTSSETPLPKGMQDCGNERQLHGKGYSESTRTCIWNAFQAGRPARWSLTLYTIEGDPIRYELEIHSRTLLSLLIDSRDRFGASGVSRRRCRMLTRNVEAGRISFELSGCQDASPEDRISIP
jgi:hypothetical protein